jgi:hypothetical protein
MRRTAVVNQVRGLLLEPGVIRGNSRAVIRTGGLPSCDGCSIMDH